VHGARLLTDAGVTSATHDVAANPTACDTVIALGRRSLSVLVAPDGTSTTGAAAGELTGTSTSTIPSRAFVRTR